MDGNNIEGSRSTPTLQDNYPTPKTYDKLQAERAEVRAVRDSRHTKHPLLAIALAILSLLAGIVAIVLIAPLLIFASPLLGVSLSLLAGLVWAYGLISTIRMIRTMIDKNPHL